MTRSFLTLLLFVVTALQVFPQSPAQRASVLLNATVQSSPPRITLEWASFSNTSSITIYRKLKNETSWGNAIASPSASSTQYQDNGVTTGITYEYKVVRSANGTTGTGYIASGIEVPMTDYRGKIVLLVDNTLASQMVSELNQLTQDLKADGWWVLRSDVSRTAPSSSIRTIVMNHYNSDPTNVKAVYMVGHVPVPYSGNQAPDGHGEHVGAWPCDGYYGEMNGSWTDNSVNNNGAQRSANRNIPGDGKFDQSNFPSDIELQVGRVDLYDMPAFSQGEAQLVKNYLTRAHNFKVKNWTPLMRSLQFDNLQWVSSPIGASGLRNMGPLTGNSNITNANQNGTAFHNLVNGESYLWTYSSGGGGQLITDGELTFNGANNIGTTQNYASNSSMGGVFNMSCGSYFGDWDNKNNFLRAPIAKGDALTSVWAGIPTWYFHHMGMGDNIGYSTRVTMNNNGLYTPITEGWQGSIGKVHLGLHGDPSLRMQMVAPPTSLSVSNAGGTASFNWTASWETVAGYHLYKFNTNGTITRLTTSPVTGTSYQNASIPFEAGREYMVRAVKLQVNYSGSYYNLSLGAIATAAGSATADCQGVVGGGAVAGAPCNDNNPCTVNDTWNSSCQCVGTATTVTASITASGPTNFCTGGSVVLNANTGSGLSYVWRRDGNTISGATSSSYTATEAGVYSVRVSNGGCEATSSGITVSTSSGLSATITASGSTDFCTGGSVVLNANTGSGYNYVWRRDGNTISGATSSSYTVDQAGVYTVRISSGGCEATSSGTTVTTNSAPSASITASGPTSFCTGGSVVLNANTGSGLSYVWRRDGSSISGATSSSYTATQAGVYTVRVYNGGCESTSSGITITTNSGITASITASGPTSFCTGGSVVLNANTGSGSSYVWRRDGSTISGATSSSYTATQAGVYTVRISNGSCEATSSGITVATTTAPAAIVTATGPTNFCSGGSVVLNANTGSGFTYVWRRDGNTISGATSASYTATQAGVYTVRVGDSGCENTSSGTTVTVGDAPSASLTAGGPTSFCAGGGVVLNANTGSGLSYVWRRDGNTISGASSASYTATQAGIYTVRVSNGTCESTSSGVAVSINSAPTASITAGGPTSLCTGGTVQLNATTGSGFSYVWRRDGTVISGANSATYTASQAGVYSVQVGNGGCTSTSPSVTVVINSMPTASITSSGVTDFCTGGSVQLSANSGAGYTYEWRRNGTVIPGASGQVHIATQSGSYAVRVANGNCSALSASVSVNVATGPTAAITFVGSPEFCVGGSIDLMANEATGVAYSWQLNGQTIAGAIGALHTATQPGVYTVTVTGNGCDAVSVPVTLSTFVTDAPGLTIEGEDTICEGESVLISSPAMAGASYIWALNGSTQTAAVGNTFTMDQEGTVSLQMITDGCISEFAEVEILMNELPVAELTTFGPTNVCTGDTVVLQATENDAYSYSWNLDGVQIADAEGQSFAAIQPGAYAVSINNGQCTNTSEVLSVSMMPNVTVNTSGNAAFCLGDSLTMIAVSDSGYSYSWSMDGTAIGQSASFTAFTSGTYVVTIESADCVASSEPIEVVASEIPVAMIEAAGPLLFCEGDSVVLASAFDNSWTYQWNFNDEVIEGATSNEYSALTSGAYSVDVTNDGCTINSGDVIITTLPVVALELSGPASFCEGDSVTINAIADEAYSYTWYMDGVILAEDTTHSITSGNSGDYQVSITDGECVASSEVVTISADEAPVFELMAGGNTSFCDGSEVWLMVDGDDVGQYDVQWTLYGSSIEDAQNDSLLVNSTGIYAVEVSNGGCTLLSDTITVTTLPIVEIAVDGGTSFCEDSEVTMSTAFDPDHTYQWSLNGEEIPNGIGHELIVTTPGDYSLYVEGNGCSAYSDTIALEMLSAPEINGYADIATGVVGVDVLSGEGPFTYMWNFDPAQDSSITSIETSGVYTVTVTDANGCTEVGEVDVIIEDQNDACIGLRSERQDFWPASEILATEFASAFPDGLTIGCGYRQMVLTSADAVAAFLPSFGPSQRLPFGMMVDPGDLYGNSLAGELVALKLAVRFDELNNSFSSTDELLGDAVIAMGQFQGMTVADLIVEADRKIGGCFSLYSRNQLRTAITNINNGYSGGTMASGYLECIEEAGRPEFEDAVTIESGIKETNVTAYPNPFLDNTMIVIGEIEFGDRVVVEILSADGVVLERIFEGDVAPGVDTRVQWNAASRAKGMYFYRVHTSQGMINGRLILN